MNFCPTDAHTKTLFLYLDKSKWTRRVITTVRLIIKYILVSSFDFSFQYDYSTRKFFQTSNVNNIHCMWMENKANLAPNSARSIFTSLRQIDFFLLWTPFINQGRSRCFVIIIFFVILKTCFVLIWHMEAKHFKKYIYIYIFHGYLFSIIWNLQGGDVSWNKLNKNKPGN